MLEDEQVAAAEGTGPVPAEIDLFEQATVGLAVTDRIGRLRHVNPAFARILGRGRGDLVGQPFSFVCSPDGLTLRSGVTPDVLATTAEPAGLELPYLRPDGSLVWLHLSIGTLAGADGEATALLVQGVDVTDRKRAERAADHDRWRLYKTQRVAGLGTFEQDPVTGAISASDELCRMLGLPVLDDVASLIERVHPDDRPMLGAAIASCFASRRPVDLVHRLLLADGTVTWVRARADWAVDEDGQGIVSGTVLDVTVRKQAEDALEYQAFHDTLTGLANRALFLDRVDHALHQAEREGAPVAALFLDLDDFKTVNDSLGHPTGDRLLIAVGERLESVARAGDTVARLGGDEFALLLESGAMPQSAVGIAERIADALQSPFVLDDTEIAVRVSIGIALGQPFQDSSADLLRDADLAMYLAKRNGKGRFEMARPGMQDEALKRLVIISDLRHALDNGELEVFYQPIVNTHDATPVGAEALVRWHHPHRGLMVPKEFVDVAESAGLIVPLGDWVLNQACSQAQCWRHAGIVDDAFYISVNLSARQLAEPALVDNVARALQRSGLPASALVLEITETALMLDFDAGLARLESLKSLGLRLALDDYGTGYSSLNRLGRLPVDIVKIDKSFIDQLTVNREGAALVQSVIDVAHALGLSSIAEGVEQTDQCAALDDMDCNHIQGYLFAEPAPAAEMARALRRLGAHRSRPGRDAALERAGAAAGGCQESVTRSDF